jgi:hypothetical protein
MVDEEIGMPAKREVSMRQLRHLLRLHHDGVSAKAIPKISRIELRPQSGAQL